MKKLNILIYFLVLLIFYLISPNSLSAQDSEYGYYFRSSFYGSTQESLPFWFGANVNGKVDQESSNFINELGFKKNIYNASNFRVLTGSNLVFRLSEKESIHFTELYSSVKYHAFQLDIGRFNQPIGLNNHDLSVGSMMVSKNAIPVTKISISNPDFVNIPFSNGILEYKGMYSHGWFTENRFVDDAYLHQKYLYLKINIDKFSGIGGIVHNAMWGGTSENQNVGKLPQSFSDYLRVITGSSADPDSDAPGGEISNALGNSLAAYEFGGSYENEKLRISLTRLFYLEDSVSRRFRSPWDGVWGMNLEFKENSSYVNAITYEHINTRRQDSRSFQARGRANYYNHFVYRSGWSNYNRVVGIPLITYDSDIGRIDNNILVGHHIGINGTLSQNLAYLVFGTYSRNYGVVGGKVPPETVDFPSRREDQFSFLFKLDYEIPNLKGFQTNLSLASDFGEFYEDRFGVMVGVTWDGKF